MTYKWQFGFGLNCRRWHKGRIFCKSCSHVADKFKSLTYNIGAGDLYKYTTSSHISTLNDYMTYKANFSRFYGALSVSHLTWFS